MSKPLTDDELRVNIKLLNNDYSDKDLDYNFIEDILLLIDREKSAALSNWSIMGKQPEEVYLILRGLDIERVTDIKVTMKNLDTIYKKLVKEMKLANERMIKNVFNSIEKKK